MLDITKDIQSLTTFRRRSGDFMKQLKKSKRPVVLTVKGKAAAIVQDAEAYQRLLDIAARADSEEGIRQGLDDVARDASDLPKRYLTTCVANMAYHIEFADRAARDLEALYVEKNAAESQAASRWYNPTMIHSSEPAIARGSKAQSA
jgi:prevent-host-death family protein